MASIPLTGPGWPWTAWAIVFAVIVAGSVGSAARGQELRSNVFSVPIDASGAAIRLSTNSCVVSNSIVSGDRSRVVYGELADNRRNALFSVSINGGQLPIKLADSIDTSRGGRRGKRILSSEEVQAFWLTPASSRVVYRAARGGASTNLIFSAYRSTAVSAP